MGPVPISLSAMMTHGALWLAATPGPASRPLALEEELGEPHFGVERGADSIGYHSWRMGRRSQVLIQNVGKLRKALSGGPAATVGGAEQVGGGMWPGVCELPLLGPRRPLPGRLETGHGLYGASSMGTWAGGGSLTPSSSREGRVSSRPSALSCLVPPGPPVPAPAVASGQNQSLS